MAVASALLDLIGSKSLEKSSLLANATDWSTNKAIGQLEAGECDPHPLLLTGRSKQVAINTRCLPRDYIHNACRATLRMLRKDIGRDLDAIALPPAAAGASHTAELKLVTRLPKVADLLRDAVLRTLLSGFGVAPVEPISLAPAGGVIVAPRAEVKCEAAEAHDRQSFVDQIFEFLARCLANGMVCLPVGLQVHWDRRKKNIVVHDMSRCFLVKTRVEWNTETLAFLRSILEKEKMEKLTAGPESFDLSLARQILRVSFTETPVHPPPRRSQRTRK